MMNVLSDLLYNRVDKSEEDSIVPMRMEFLIDNLYITYRYQGLVITEMVPFESQCATQYWVYDIDAKELARLLPPTEKFDFQYDDKDGTLWVIDGKSNPHVAKYDWDLESYLDSYNTNDIAFAVDCANFKQFIAVAKVAKLNSSKVYVHACGGKTVMLNAFTPTLITYQCGFSMREPKEIEFTMPTEAIIALEEETHPICFIPCPNTKKIWAGVYKKMVRFDMEAAVVPSIQALPERYSNSITVDVEELAEALQDVANTRGISGVSALENSSANQAELSISSFSAESERILFVSGAKGVKKLVNLNSATGLTVCKVAVCSIRLTDILQNISCKTVRLKLPRNGTAPLMVDMPGAAYLLFGIETMPFTAIDWRSVSDARPPKPDILYRGTNANGTELQVQRIEESLLKSRYSIDNMLAQQQSIEMNWDTSDLDRVGYHFLVEEIREVHHALLEMKSRLEAAYSDDPNPLVQKAINKFRGLVSKTYEVTDTSDLTLARGEGFPTHYLEALLEEALWLGSHLLQVLSSAHTTYQLQVVVK